MVIAVIQPNSQEESKEELKSIIFLSDNGPNTNWGTKGYGQTLPLRGAKGSTFEGGIRTPAFISGGYVENNCVIGNTYDNIVHIQNIYTPTHSAHTQSITHTHYTISDHSTVDVNNLKIQNNNKNNQNTNTRIAPSISPTQPPSMAPSIAPTQPPSQPPSIAQSIAPSMTPSIAPTQPPSMAPSIAPTQPPSSQPNTIITEHNLQLHNTLHISSPIGINNIVPTYNSSQDQSTMSKHSTEEKYSFVSHWVWHKDGWLNKLGFVDGAGAMIVHSTAGMGALITVWKLCAREDSRPIINAIGAMFLWYGWFAFNVSPIAFSKGIDDALPTTAFTWMYFGFVDLSFESLLSCLLAGLISITGVCHIKPVYHMYHLL